MVQKEKKRVSVYSCKEKTWISISSLAGDSQPCALCIKDITKIV